MKSRNINEQIETLIQSPHNIQEFANLTSPEENW